MTFFYFRQMSSMTTSSTNLLYITMCGKDGLVIYMTWVLINSALTYLALHLMGTRLSICLVAMLKHDLSLTRTW